MSQFLFFMESKAYILLSYGLGLENVQDAELDYLGHSALSALRLPLPLKISSTLSYNYNFQNYNNVTASIGERRFDEVQTVRLNLSRPVFDSFEIYFDLKRVMTNSNLASVDSIQNVAFVGLDYKM